MAEYGYVTCPLMVYIPAVSAGTDMLLFTTTQLHLSKHHSCEAAPTNTRSRQQKHVLVILQRSGSGDELEDKPVGPAEDADLYKLTLPTEVSAAPKVHNP